MSYKNHVRDNAIADEANVDRSLMCPAQGCQNRWSVDGERGRACSAHYWADPREWPRITQQLLDADAERALRYGRVRVPPSAPKLTTQERRAAVQALQACCKQAPDRTWAAQLQARHQRGERLTLSQVQAYRSALYGRNFSTTDPITEETTS